MSCYAHRKGVALKDDVLGEVRTTGLEGETSHSVRVSEAKGVPTLAIILRPPSPLGYRQEAWLSPAYPAHPTRRALAHQKPLDVFGEFDL
jgi:hypothetical protein